jgi:hypothetical protein
MDQEEILSPVPISGDLMKIFEHQDIPGVDQIMSYGRASAAYKLISSAANNYDKPAVMCEVFGAMGEDMPVENLYREAIDQFAKGINFVVPHGTWYDGEKNVIFPPELSFRSKKFGPVLPDYNKYVKRTSALLRGGRHISDIAVLYPIADLSAYHVLGESDPYLGGNIAPHVNYMKIGEALSLEIRKDFTYIHPDILNAKCIADNGRLILDNAENRECYKVVILPAVEVIHAENLEKLRQFTETGGTVISVGLLPSKSAEYGQDNKVRKLTGDLFDYSDCCPFTLRMYGNGGRCYYIPVFTPEILSSVLKDTGIIFDVECAPVTIDGGNFTYIHKESDGRDIYFFVNSSDIPVSAEVKLRGQKFLELWNPHDGDGNRVKAVYTVNKDGTTTVLVELDPVKSVFFVNTE